jgi:hypothetical protein
MTDSTDADWNTPPEGPPAMGAPARDVAPYLEEAIWEHIWDLSVAQQRRALRDLCETNDWSWTQVAPAFRKHRVAAAAGKSDLGTVEYTHSGIPVYPDLFSGPQSTCPFKHRFFHLGHFTDAYIEKTCGSLSERECGPREAERLLRQLKLRIAPLTKVYVAQVPWEEGLPNRMSQRRFARGMSTLMYRTVADNVTFVADKRLDGTDPPASCEEVSWKECVELVIPQLAVPLHHSHRWSERWKFFRSRDNGSDILISLIGLSDDQVDEFKVLAAEAAAEYGVDPGTPIPPEHWESISEDLRVIRDDLRKGRL